MPFFETYTREVYARRFPRLKPARHTICVELPRELLREPAIGRDHRDASLQPFGEARENFGFGEARKIGVGGHPVSFALAQSEA